MAKYKRNDETGRKDNRRDSVVTIAGEVMTIEERNRRMKLEYTNGGKSLKDIALDYGLTYNTVRVISCNERWKDYKEQFKRSVADEAEKKLHDIYVGTVVDVNLMYNNLWQKLMLTASKMLEDEDALKKNGKLDVYKINQLADIITKAHQGQQITTGFVSREAQAKLDMNKTKLDISKEKLEIQKSLLGMDENEVIDDNFLKALGYVAEACGIAEKEPLADEEE